MTGCLSAVLEWLRSQVLGMCMTQNFNNMAGVCIEEAGAGHGVGPSGSPPRFCAGTHFGAGKGAGGHHRSRHEPLGLPPPHHKEHEGEFLHCPHPFREANDGGRQTVTQRDLPTYQLVVFVLTWT